MHTVESFFCLKENDDLEFTGKQTKLLLQEADVKIYELTYFIWQ